MLRQDVPVRWGGHGPWLTPALDIGPDLWNSGYFTLLGVHRTEGQVSTCVLSLFKLLHGDVS